MKKLFWPLLVLALFGCGGMTPDDIPANFTVERGDLGPDGKSMCPNGPWDIALDSANLTAVVRCKGPGPSPTAAPSVAPSASPSFPTTTTTTSTTTTTTTTTLPQGPVGCFGPCPAFPGLTCPCENTCPASFNVAASRVGVGETPGFNRQSNTRAKVTIHLSSKSQPPLCPHRGNVGECEQWMPCAQVQDKAGYPPIAWYAAYPGFGCNAGSVNDGDCQVERASRLCDAEEQADDASKGLDPKACRRPNGWALTDIVGTGGGVPGVRRVCALPPAWPGPGRQTRTTPGPFDYRDWIRREVDGEVVWKRKLDGAEPTRRRAARQAAAPSCRAWDIDLNRARLVE